MSHRLDQALALHLPDLQLAALPHSILEVVRIALQRQQIPTLRRSILALLFGLLQLLVRGAEVRVILVNERRENPPILPPSTRMLFDYIHVFLVFYMTELGGYLILEQLLPDLGGFFMVFGWSPGLSRAETTFKLGIGCRLLDIGGRRLDLYLDI